MGGGVDLWFEHITSSKFSTNFKIFTQLISSVVFLSSSVKTNIFCSVNGGTQKVRERGSAFSLIFPHRKCQTLHSIGEPSPSVMEAYFPSVMEVLPFSLKVLFVTCCPLSVHTSSSLPCHHNHTSCCHRSRSTKPLQQQDLSRLLLVPNWETQSLSQPSVPHQSRHLMWNRSSTLVHRICHRRLFWSLSWHLIHHRFSALYGLRVSLQTNFEQLWRLPFFKICVTIVRSRNLHGCFSVAWVLLYLLCVCCCCFCVSFIMYCVLCYVYCVLV